MTKLQQTDKATFWAFDVLKMLLAVIVLLRHVAQSFSEADSLYHTIVVNIISPIAVPVFFAISGFLLFYKPVTKERLLHQIKRVLILYIGWTIIYMPLSLWGILRSEQSAIKEILEYVQNFLFSGSNYHLWFLPSLAFSLFMVAMLDKYLKPIWQAVVLLILFVLGAALENFEPWLPGSLLQIYKMYCAVFLTTRNGLFYGAIFVWIGKSFAQNHGAGCKTDGKKYGIGLLIAIACMALEGLLVSRSRETMVVNMLFSQVMVVFALMGWLIPTTAAKQCKYNTAVWRKASTIVFCVHPILIFGLNVAGKLGIQLSAVTASCIVLVISVLGAMLAVNLSQKLPILRFFL